MSFRLNQLVVLVGPFAGVPCRLQNPCVTPGSTVKVVITAARRDDHGCVWRRGDVQERWLSEVAHVVATDNGGQDATGRTLDGNLVNLFASALR